MSRIGHTPVAIPKGVTVTTQQSTISVKGPKGNLSFDVPPGVTFKLDNEQITFDRADDDRRHRALHGMARARTANIVRGCSEGFTRVLEINGVGYRAFVKGSQLELALGYSHPIFYDLPKGVSAEVLKDGSIVLSSADKALVGQVAADVRAFRPPEPYKGKGIKYKEERIIRKEGKARATK